MKINHCLLLLALLCYACTGIDKESLLEYTDANRAKLEQRYEGTEFASTLRFIPADLAALRDFERSDNPQVSFDEYRADYIGDYEFELKLQDKPGSAGLSKRIAEHAEKDFIANYYNYKAITDIKMVIGQDTMPAKAVHCVQTGGITNDLQFICLFNKPINPVNPYFRILFFDRIFGKEIHSFTFDARDFEQVPVLTNFSSTHIK